MDIKRLQALVVDALEDVKAQEIAVFDTVHLTALFDRVAIASGTSNRQTKALAASVRDKVKSAGGVVVSMEGEDTGEWVLVDLGDMIVHIMQPAIRAYYRLEEIWGDKPIKLADAKRALKSKARSDDDSDSEVEAKPRRRVASKTAVTRASSADKESAAPKRARKSAADDAPAPRRAAKAPARTATKSGAKAATKSGAKPAPKGAGLKTSAKTASKTAGKSAAPRKTAAKTPVGKTVKVAASKSVSARPARKTASR